MPKVEAHNPNFACSCTFENLRYGFLLRLQSLFGVEQYLQSVMLFACLSRQDFFKIVCGIDLIQDRHMTFPVLWSKQSQYIQCYRIEIYI